AAPVGDVHHRVAGALQCSLDDGADVGVVLDDENRGGGHGRVPCSGSGFVGMHTRTVVPAPSVLSTSIVAEWRSATTFAIVRPSPVPGIWGSRAFEPRRKRRNAVSSSPAGMPMPSSRTSIVQPDGIERADTQMWPPSWVNFTALVTRLSTSRPRLSASP